MARSITPPSQRDYGILFNELKKQNPGLNCLFLEWSPNDKNAQNLIAGEKSESFQYIQHSELVAAARAFKTKIFAVDGRDMDLKFDPQNVGSYVRDSNIAIHKNIMNLFDSGTCQAGIVLIGKAHVEHPQIQIEPKNSLKTFFQQSAIPTVAINFVYTGKNIYADNIDQQWNWNICSDEPHSKVKKSFDVMSLIANREWSSIK